MNRLMEDLAVDRQDPEFRERDRWDPDEEEEEDDGGEETIIDRCKDFSFRHYLDKADQVIIVDDPRRQRQYIDVTKTRGSQNDDVSWPRPQ
jgi:hypothetical protein